MQPAARAWPSIARRTGRELAWAAAKQGFAEEIHPSTIFRILAGAECKPHRVRYWLRSQSPQFREKTTRVRWSYERAAALFVRGTVVCVAAADWSRSVNF